MNEHISCICFFSRLPNASLVFLLAGRRTIAKLSNKSINCFGLASRLLKNVYICFMNKFKLATAIIVVTIR